MTLKSLAAIACSLLMAACGSAPPPDDLAALGNGSAAAFELRGLPKVNDLPPVAPQAGGRAVVTGVSGPRNAHLAWNVLLPFSESNTIQVIGSDGTVYVAGGDGLGAVRDGVLIWAVQAPRPRVTMADDGRIWFAGPELAGYFCLNRAGQGGLLPGSIRPPADAAEAPLAGCTEGGRSVILPGGRSVALDYECTRPQAKLGPDGMAYVGTLAPDIRAFTPDGALAWKVKTPCAAQRLLAGSGGRVLFSCKDLSLYYIENGAVKWSRPGDGEIDEGNIIKPSSSFLGVMDRDGATYFVDRTINGLQTHIHGLKPTGEMMWTLQTSIFSASSIGFDGRGRLYLTGMRGMSHQLVCLSD